MPECCYSGEYAEFFSERRAARTARHYQVLVEKGLQERVDRRVADFVATADQLPAADIVILHRVLCCYPDWPAMLGGAMAKSRRVVAFTVPVDRWWTRAAITFGNAVLRLCGRQFRAFVHPPGPMFRALEVGGFRVRGDRPRWVWRTIAAERSTPATTTG